MFVGSSMYVKNKILLSATLIILTMLLLSCSLTEIKSRGEIKAINYVPTYDIAKGECCVIKWNIINADLIVFNTKKYNSIDSVRVCPNDTTIYTLETANADETRFFKFKVNVNPSSPKIQTGYEYVAKTNDTISIEISEYLAGVIPSNYNSTISHIKIMKFKAEKNKLYLNALPLDMFGNFIEGYKFSPQNTTLQIKPETGENHYLCRIESIHPFKSQNRNHFYFVLENSFNSQHISDVVNNLRISLQSFSPNDLASVYLVNHKIEKIVNTTNPQMASLYLSSHSINPKGLNSTANALIEVLSDIKNSPSNTKISPVVVLCNFSGDNSSITHTLSDVVKAARANNVPIYTIGIGLDSKSYQLTPTSYGTFARNYILNYNEIDNLTKIFNEIYFAQKNGYTIVASYDENEIDQYNINDIKISTNSETSYVEDKIKWYKTNPDIYTPYQIISLFDHLGYLVPNEYTNKIEELADLLKDNPEAKIELIGHTNFETIDDAEDIQLALQRAESVKQKLLENGVSDKQVTIKTKGNNYPLYYFPKIEWQIAINRRVEIRWIDPTLLPFEIFAQTAISEAEANKYVEEWEKLGYRSYYQREVDRNHDVVYKVKLWGFATQSEAETVIRMLSFKFPNLTFKLE